MIRPESMTDFEATLVHEMGHKVSRALHHRQKASLVTEAMDSMGEVGARMNMSPYGLSSHSEFIAEAFVEVMAKGEQAHPALVELVRKVMNG